MEIQAFEAARSFLRSSARVLERRMAERILDGGPARPVVAALSAYANPDGGLGHGLEPDKRAPSSQPLDVQFAFEAMDAADAVDEAIVAAACDWLASLGPGVGCLVPAAQEHPRAGHWDRPTPPDLNPTAALAGLLWKWDIDHPWRADATGFCLDRLRDGLPTEAHTMAGVLTLLAHHPGSEAPVALPEMSFYRPEPGGDGYGLTPLDLVGTADHPLAGLFTADVVGGHLDALEAEQTDDGGWPISWEPPSGSARLEWRGIRTLRALVTLGSHSRLPLAT